MRNTDTDTKKSQNEFPPKGGLAQPWGKGEELCHVGLRVASLLLHVQRNQFRWLGRRVVGVSSQGRCFRHVPLGGGPRADPGNFTSQLTWECLSDPSQELDKVADNNAINMDYNLLAALVKQSKKNLSLEPKIMTVR